MGSEGKQAEEEQEDLIDELAGWLTEPTEYRCVFQLELIEHRTISDIEHYHMLQQ